VGELLTQNKARLTDISPYIDVDGKLKFAVIMAPAVSGPPVARSAMLALRPRVSPVVLNIPPPPARAPAAAAPATAAPSAAGPATTTLVVGNDGPAPPSLEPYFNLTFDYCVVQLRRPWMSGDFLTSGGWYIQGARAGDHSAGPPSGPPATPGGPAAADQGAGSSQPAPAQTGESIWIPVACIAVRNLVIQARGAALDASVASTATAFGPFHCAPSAAGSDSLRNPGIQIIAWICAAQPQLPPATDPALGPPAVVPSSAAQTAGAAG